MHKTWARVAPVLLATLVLDTRPVHAEDEGKFSPNIYLGSLYDSNIFRFPNGENAESSVVLQYGAGLDAVIPLSQQFLDLNVSAVRNHYNSDDSFDYTDTRALARWRWRFGNLWNGDVGATYHHDLSPFDELQSRIKDTRDYYTAGLSATRSLTQRWAVELSGDHDGLRHDLDSRRPLDRDVDRASGELRYAAIGTDSSIGVRATRRWVDFPNREAVAANLIDNSHTEQEYSAVLKWQASERSYLSGQAGYSLVHHNEFTQRDFSGPVGSISYRYETTEGTGIELASWHDISVWTDTTASFMTESGIKVRPFLQYSYHLSFEAVLSATKRRFEGDPLLTVSSVPTRRDIIQAAEISAIYNQYENLRYQLTLHSEDRDSNRDAKDYRYSLVGISLQANF